MLKTAKIVGLNSDTDAAIALVSGEQRLYLFIIVSASLEDAFAKTRQALSEAESTFYSSDKSVADRIQEVYSAIKTCLAEAEEINILIAATQEEESDTFFYFLGQTNNLEAYLVRDGKRTNLCALSEAQVISGMIKEGDRILMATKTLNKILQDDLMSLEKIDIAVLEDEVASKLPEAENYPVAAIVIEKEKTIVPKEEIVKEIIPVENDSPYEPGIKTKTFLKNVLKKVNRAFRKLIPRSKRGFAIIGVILLIIVIFTVISGYKNQKSSEVATQTANYLKTATDEFNKAQSLKDTNTSDAVLSLNNAQSALNAVFKIEPKNVAAQALKNKIAASLPEITKTTVVSDFPVWLDLNLIKQGFSATQMSLSGSNLLILDDSKKTLVKINLANKSQATLAGSDKIGNAEFASLYGGVAFIYAKDKGILKIDATNNTLSVVAKPDEAWGTVAGLYGFGGNVYLLDTKQIWKYLPTEVGYSDKRAYLKDNLDLSNVSKMEIDSSVWLLKNNLEILKFSQGVAEFFSYANLDKPIKEISTFFVSSDTDNLYLIDKGNQRLVVLDKTGKYQSQYTSDKFANFTDFVVDEPGKKVYLLQGSQIFQMDLH